MVVDVGLLPRATAGLHVKMPCIKDKTPHALTERMPQNLHLLQDMSRSASWPWLRELLDKVLQLQASQDACKKHNRTGGVNQSWCGVHGCSFFLLL